LWLALLWLASVAAAAESPGDYAFAVPIDGVASDALYRVAVPRVVYESAAFADLRDVRVFNGADEIVPHAFRPFEQISRKSEPVALPYFPLRGPRGAQPDDLDLRLEKSGGRLSVRVTSRAARGGRETLLGYVIDASALKEPLAGLDLDWSRTGESYVAAVRVEAGDDLRRWAALSADTLVSLARGAARLERKTIEFRPHRAKYLRLTWADPARTVELKSVLGLPPERAVPAEREWKEIAAQPDAGKRGDYRLEVGGLFPLDRLALRLPQENTVAPVRIYSRARPADEWTPIARAVVYRLRQDGRELANPDIVVATNSHRHWLLRVDPESGGIGSGMLIVRAGWTPREIVFTARGPGPYRMAYGNTRARANALAIEALVPGWRTDSEPKLPPAMTGAPQELAGAAAARQRLDFKKWSLWGALLAGVGLLAWMAWRLWRQMSPAEGDRR
jgi:hypothetical protein